MANAGFKHSEAFLQWIWENLIFDFTHLRTTCGKKLTILNPGQLNTTDGPDFKFASIEAEGFTWHGDIEVHTKCTHWNAHGHQNDPHFNSVILHVVADQSPHAVKTFSGSSPYTLNLLPYLSPELHEFLKSFRKPDEIPCSSGFNFISEEAFHEQINKAHTEYFEKKTDDFLRYYPANLLPSQAWKQALIISIWDGLGISHNRKPMRQTARQLLRQWDGKSRVEGIQLANALAGFNTLSGDTCWNYKSVRPANHPKNRICQAVALSYSVLQEPFGQLLQANSPDLWNTWLLSNSLNNSGRMKILFGTVYLPSLYLLGKLFANHRLSQKAMECWKALKTPIPASLLKELRSLHFKDKSYQKRLGTIHQLKSYCKPGKCSECFVLKNAILS